jgi:CotH kinase protein
MPRRAVHSSSWNAALVVALASAVALLIGLIGPSPTPPPAPDAYSFPAGQTIDLQIGPKKMEMLQARRDEALQVGILQDDDSSWVKAKLVEGAQAWPIKMRLKGDWTDHLEGAKWSWRVELKDSGAWRRLTVFSLQSPERRGYLSEWLFHQVLAGEGLLTPRYDFIRLRLNGRLLGTYAIEEHFSKQLLESQQRREGPILKIDESGMWDARVVSMHNSAFPYLQTPFFEAAPVLPFKKKGILKDSLLSAQLANAQRLMQQYRADAGQPAHVFDLALAAKQYALTDLFATYHSLIWHNRRYYFNPITQLLEPVVFDGYSGAVNDTYISVPFWGYRLHGHSRDDDDYRDVTSVYVFQDPDFVRAYYHALERYSAPAYLDSVLQALAPAMATRAKLLRGEYLTYRFDRAPIVAQATRIRNTLRDSLRADHLRVQTVATHDGRTYVSVCNHNPLPVEIWVAGQADAPQYLEADCGQPAQAEARFWLQPGEGLRYRLPGRQDAGWVLEHGE